MKEKIEQLTNNIKKQTEVYLLDAGEFYPFGASINAEDTLKPLSAYSESENPPSVELINLLENYIKRSLQEGKYKIAAIGIDVTVKEKGISFDAVEIRFFEPGHIFKQYYKYYIKENHVEFVRFITSDL